MNIGVTEKGKQTEVATGQNNARVPVYSPDVDVYDNKDSLIVVMDLPGVAKGDVTIEIDENNVLSVRGKASYQESQGIVVREFDTGDYYRAFSLNDDFNKDAVSAKLDNGVLEITIPRKEEAKPRKVQISA